MSNQARRWFYRLDVLKRLTLRKGVLFDSGEFDGLAFQEAFDAIAAKLEADKGKDCKLPST
ncbi:hypothetical protein O9992_13520 [Vibrio lentus]|nr:hypothetical protein [Vibrio lentus]